MEWESAEEGEIVSDSEQRNRQVSFEAYMNYTALSLSASEDQLQQNGTAAHESALDTPRIQRFSESDEHDYSTETRSQSQPVRACPASLYQIPPTDPCPDINQTTAIITAENVSPSNDPAAATVSTNSRKRSHCVSENDGELARSCHVAPNGLAHEESFDTGEIESESEWSGAEDGRTQADANGEAEVQPGDETGQCGATPGAANEPSGVKEAWYIIEKGRDPLELLPEGWIEVRHASGTAVYLHKQTRVCTLARPYLLGPASVRKHRLPISAIPCLHYRTELDKEKLAAVAPAVDCPAATAGTAACDVAANDTNCLGEREQKANDENVEVDTAGCKTDECSSPKSRRPRVITAQERRAQTLLSPKQVRDYCARLFEFRCVEVPRFRTWKDRRLHFRQLKAQRYQQLADADGAATTATDATNRAPQKPRPNDSSNSRIDKTTATPGVTSIVLPSSAPSDAAGGERASMPKASLPSNTLLIQCASATPGSGPTVAPTQPRKGAGRPAGEFVINAAGKSFVCILHEYVQHAMRTQPAYRFRELDNAKTPYAATVTIGEREFATGSGDSKKSAKLEAARLTLATLIPEMKQFCTETKIKPTTDYAFFDEIRIEDPRLYELSFKAGLPTPYQILDEYIKRNCIGDDKLEMNVKAMKNQRSQCSMQLGAYRVKVTCRNKREGKQLAAQTMLKRIYPHLAMWGSVLRMYMPTWRQEREKIEVPLRDERDKRRAEPNHGLIERLKRDMMNTYHDRCTHFRGLHVRGKLRFEVAHAETQTDVLDFVQKHSPLDAQLPVSSPATASAKCQDES